MHEIRAGIRAAVEAVSPGIDWRGIEPSRPLREQVDLDSLDWLNFLAELAERLSVPIPASDYAQLKSVDSIGAYLASALARSAAVAAPPTVPGAGALPCRQFVIANTTVTVRPIVREDRELEANFVRHLSTGTRYKRFMVTLRELPEAKLTYLTEVDQIDHVALVAVAQRDSGAALLGVARYVVDTTRTNCEFAIAIDDAWQGSGLAGILMYALIDIARGRGLKTMEGLVLANNARMLKFTRQLGFRAARDPDEHEVVRVVRDL